MDIDMAAYASGQAAFHKARERELERVIDTTRGPLSPRQQNVLDRQRRQRNFHRGAYAAYHDMAVQLELEDDDAVDALVERGQTARSGHSALVAELDTIEGSK